MLALPNFYKKNLFVGQYLCFILMNNGLALKYYYLQKYSVN